MKPIIALLAVLSLALGCTTHKPLGADPQYTVPSGYVANGSTPWTHNKTTGAALFDVGSGTLTAPSSITLSGTVTTTPKAYYAALGAYTTTAGTAATTVSVPTGSREVTVWAISGTSNLLIGGGTTGVPSYPAKLPVSGGTMAVQSSSGTATVGTVFGG